MRAIVLFTVALASSTFACAAPTADDDASEASEAAVITAPRTLVTRYRATFSVDGAGYTLAIDLTQPSTIITNQVVQSSQAMSDSAHCIAYLGSFSGRLDARVIASNGSVVAQRSETAWFNTTAPVPSCPTDGVFGSRPRPVGELVSEVLVDGLAFQAGGKAVHVPAGYAGPGLFDLGGKVSYEATSTGSFTSKRSPGSNGSSLAIPRGIARFEVLRSLAVKVGVGPSMRTSTGYERVIDLQLAP